MIKSPAYPFGAATPRYVPLELPENVLPDNGLKSIRAFDVDAVGALVTWNAFPPGVNTMGAPTCIEDAWANPMFIAAAAPVSIFTALLVPDEENVTEPLLVYVPPAEIVAVPTEELFVDTLKTEVGVDPDCKSNNFPDGEAFVSDATITAFVGFVAVVT